MSKLDSAQLDSLMKEAGFDLDDPGMLSDADKILSSVSDLPLVKETLQEGEEETKEETATQEEPETQEPTIDKEQSTEQDKLPETADEYRETLSPSERAEFDLAVSNKFNYERFKQGGHDFRTHNIQTPLFERLKEQSKYYKDTLTSLEEKVKKSEDAATKMAKLYLKQNKQAYEAIKQDAERAYHETESRSDAEAHIRRFDEANREVALIDAELAELEKPPEPTEHPLRQALQSASDAFVKENAWLIPGNEKYDQQRHDRAVILEEKLLREYAAKENPDFAEMYARIKEATAPLPAQAAKEEKPRQTTPAVGGSKPAHTAKGGKDITEEDKTFIEVLDMLSGQGKKGLPTGKEYAQLLKEGKL